MSKSDGKSYTVNLRPHHGLCSQFYTGNGYSRDFTDNMTEVMNLLNKNNPKVKIVGGCDDICERCPKNIDGECENEDNVRLTDNQCLEEYGLCIGDELCWNDLKASVVSRLKSTNRLPSVCKGCQWLQICGKADLSKLK